LRTRAQYSREARPQRKRLGTRPHTNSALFPGLKSLSYYTTVDAYLSFSHTAKMKSHLGWWSSATCIKAWWSDLHMRKLDKHWLSCWAVCMLWCIKTVCTVPGKSGLYRD